MRSRTPRVPVPPLTFVLVLALGATLPGCTIKITGNYAKLFKKIYKIAANVYGLSLGQCSPLYADINEFIEVTFEFEETPPPAPGWKPTRDYYLAFEGTGQRNNAFVRPDYTLQGAFDVQFTSGRFDLGKPLPAAGAGAFWAGELDRLDSDPLQFVTAGLQHGENPLGTQVFVATEAGTQGSLFLPGASRVDTRFASDGKGSLTVWARPTFGTTFLEVDTVAIDPAARYQFGAGVVALGDGEQVGFDNAQVLANEASGALPGTAEAAGDMAWQAVLHIADAHRLLDGSAPDQVEAGQHLEQAGNLLDQVAAFVDQPDEPDKDKSKMLVTTLAYAKLARSSVFKAEDQVEHGKPVQKVRKTLNKALEDASKALSGLEALANITH